MKVSKAESDGRQQSIERLREDRVREIAIFTAYGSIDIYIYIYLFTLLVLSVAGQTAHTVRRLEKPPGRG